MDNTLLRAIWIVLLLLGEIVTRISVISALSLLVEEVSKS